VDFNPGNAVYQITYPVPKDPGTEPVPTILYSVKVVLKKGINIRSGSSKTSQIIGDLKYEDQSTIIAENDTKTYGMFAEGKWITLDPTFVKKI